MHLAGMLAHDARPGGELVGGLSPHGQAHQERADLFGGRLAGQELVESPLKRSDVQWLAAGNGQQGGGETV